MNWDTFWDLILMAIVGSTVLGLVIENVGSAISNVVGWFRKDEEDDDD